MKRQFASAEMESETGPTGHGVEEMLWDNIGEGWRIHCLCGWVTAPSKLAATAGAEFDFHLAEVGLLKE